jgi:hypothetical protein
MSIFQLFNSSINDLKKRFSLYILISVLYVLFIWTQDLIPLLGALLSSIATTLLIAKLLSAHKVHPRLLIMLGLLMFPLNLAWTIILALFQNSDSILRAQVLFVYPLLIFLFAALIYHATTVQFLLQGETSLDKALKAAWLLTYENRIPWIVVAITLASIWFISVWVWPMIILFLTPPSLGLLTFIARGRRDS